MQHQFAIPARWGDMDALSHFNNVVYLDYLQEARVELLLSGPNAHLLDEGVLVASHQLEYLAQGVFSGDPVEASVVVHDVGAARFFIGYELRVRDALVLRARTQACAFDRGANTVRRLAPDEREWFESVSGTFEPLRTLGRIEIAERPSHRYPQRIRWSDLDPYGHVNNVRMADYFQEARVEMFWGHDALSDRRAGSAGPGGLDGIWLIARLDIDYLAQLDFRQEPYTVRTAVQRLGNTSVTLSCDLCDETTGTRYAAGTVVLVHVGDSGTPTPLPEALRTRVARWLLDS